MALSFRYFRRRVLRPKPILIILILILLLDIHHISSTIKPPTRTDVLAPEIRNDKIYIASINRNSEYILRLYWMSALLALVKKLGPSNVFVSIMESGSQEDTKGALRELEGQLNEIGVETRLVLGMNVTEQIEEISNPPEGKEGGVGWVYTGRYGTGWEIRRIPYLARLRNRVMEPLNEISGRRRFDKVLWINDVVFTTEDVITLLSTRSGSYAAACSLDFSKSPLRYYDTFALRDALGLPTATLTYPYFFSSASRSALRNMSPIPVQSCWNGMIAMDASPFYSSTTSPLGLQFRGVPDSLAREHVEGSECCLIHADNARLRSEKGVWLNPNVRVAFNASTYGKVNPGVTVKADLTGEVSGSKLPGGELGLWPGKMEAVKGVWRNRVVRWVGSGWVERRRVGKKVRRWVEKARKRGTSEVREEIGVECLVDEMQVLYGNGWMHV